MSWRRVSRVEGSVKTQGGIGSKASWKGKEKRIIGKQRVHDNYERVLFLADNRVEGVEANTHTTVQEVEATFVSDAPPGAFDNLYKWMWSMCTLLVVCTMWYFLSILVLFYDLKWIKWLPRHPSDIRVKPAKFPKNTNSAFSIRITGKDYLILYNLMCMSYELHLDAIFKSMFSLLVCEVVSAGVLLVSLVISSSVFISW